MSVSFIFFSLKNIYNFSILNRILYVTQRTTIATTTDIRNGHKVSKIFKITDYAKIIPRNITVNCGFLAKREISASKQELEQSR